MRHRYSGANGATQDHRNRRRAALAIGLAATWIGGAAMAQTTLPAAPPPPNASTETKAERVSPPMAAEAEADLRGSSGADPFSAAASPEAFPPSQDSAVGDAVMLRMQASAETAVPIEDLDDALVTTGSIAQDGDARSAMASPEGSGGWQALAYAPVSVERVSTGSARNVDVLQAAAVPVAPDTGATGARLAQAGRILSSVKLRAKPENAAEIVSVLAENAAVTVFGCDYWCEVQAGDKRGFVYKKFVAKGQPSGERAAEKQEP